MTKHENIAKILDVLIDLTDKLCDHVEREEFERVFSMLENREHLLEQEAGLVHERRDALQDDPELLVLRPKFDALKQLDEKFVTLFSSKKAEVAQRLKQAQNERMLLAYSQ